jgi:hypothetical protein
MVSRPRHGLVDVPVLEHHKRAIPTGKEHDAPISPPPEAPCCGDSIIGHKHEVEPVKARFFAIY